MKKLIFESIILISHKEKRARKESFHPHKNLIVGKNHTGKSSLLKTLYLTLGARPKGKLQQWDENTASIVNLSIDNKKFTILYQQGNRALFDETGKIIGAEDSHAEWVELFSNLTGFNLLMTDKKQETVKADVKCFFLPFYIDQDSSWGSDWNTFAGLQQFKAPIPLVLDYFSGVKPPEFYLLNSKKKQNQTSLADNRKEFIFLEKAKKRLEEKLDFNKVKISYEAFEKEVEELTSRVNGLNKQQQSIRATLVNQKDVIESINLQIASSQFALQTYEKDSSYLTDLAESNLSCPTCGAEHSDTFLEFLTYADDARILRELISRLRKDLKKLEGEYNQNKRDLIESKNEYDKIELILKTNRDNVKFKDVIDSVSSEMALTAFNEEELTIKNEIDRLIVSLDEIEQQIKKTTNLKKSKLILDNFRSTYKSYRFKLNLPQVETTRLKLSSRPDISGSGGPRAILAYYAALWSVCYSEYSSYNVPIIIDSPNQKAQDELNLPKVLKFIFEELPVNAQTIIGSEIFTEHDFDKTIQLTEPYSLLKEELYDIYEAEYEKHLKDMYQKLEENSEVRT